MSFQIADLFNGKAEQDVLDVIEGEFQVIEKAVSSNPAVTSAVTTLKNDAMDVASELSTWAGTAADAALGVLTSKAQAAIAPMITEFLAGIGISATGPLGVAETVMIQAAIAAVQAAGHAAVVAAIPAPKPPG